MAYHTGNTYHAVKVFKLRYEQNERAVPLLSFGCTSCRFEEECMPLVHKQDKCMVANDCAEILVKNSKGHVNSFYCDAFYLNTNPKRTRILINLLIKLLNEKYQKCIQ